MKILACAEPFFHLIFFSCQAQVLKIVTYLNWSLTIGQTLPMYVFLSLYSPRWHTDRRRRLLAMSTTGISFKGRCNQGPR